MPETPKLVEAVARAIVGSVEYDAMPVRMTRQDRLYAGQCEWYDQKDAYATARDAIDAIRNHNFGDTIVLVNGTDPVATLKGDLPGTVLRALIDLAMAEGGERGQDA